MRITRKFANPVVSVLLFAGLWWTLAQLPAKGSIVGSIFRTCRCSSSQWLGCAVYRDAQGEPALWTSPVPPSEDEMIAYVRWIGAYECPTCIAFPTQRTATGRLVWDEAPGTLSDADKVNLRAKFADHFDTLRPGMAADPELRLAIDAIQQDATLSSPIYSGYWKNLGLVMIFGALLRSLRWVTDSLHGHRTEAIREFRLAYDQCPGCAYDIRGLPNHRCPECGATWTYHELEMAREKRSRNTE